MKSQLLSLFECLLLDSSRLCGVEYTHRDMEYVTARTEREGLSFLTITLPTYGKALLKALDRGYIGDDLFTSFRSGRGGIPRFLGGFLRQVFGEDGSLLTVPSTTSILCLRQLSLAFQKIEVPCSPSRERKALRKWVQIEQELLEFDLPSLLDFKKVSLWVFGDIFSELDGLIYNQALSPYPGPGGVADKISYNQRFLPKEWTERLEWDFPYYMYGTPFWSVDCYDQMNVLSPGAERPVKVQSVPKTLETPRIITVEPSVMQFAQQALLHVMKPAIESLKHSPIGLSDQEKNRQWARKGSIDGELATLDLSDASDRVSNLLVQCLFDGFPNLDGLVQSSRSTRAKVKGEIINLTKFAGMGSALTFPVEAMVFLTIVLLGLFEARGLTISRSNCRKALREVCIYGDDIIVPTDVAPIVATYLELFGLKVNVSKSFWTGKFRESCGADWYAGEWVTPVRVRRPIAQSLQNGSEIVSTYSLMNQLDDLGFKTSADHLERHLAGFHPVKGVGRSSPALGRFSKPLRAERMHPHHQTAQIKALTVRDDPPPDFLDGAGAMLKFSLQRRPLQGPISEIVPLGHYPGHLLHAGRSRRVTLKVGWASLQ